MKKIYLAVPIINYYNNELTKKLANLIQDLGFELTSPWVLSGVDTDISPQDVFIRDTMGVKASDIILAEVSKPSHGVGMEIMLAYMEGKRIILLAKKDVKLSALLEGIKDATIIRYEDEGELSDKLGKELGKGEV
uniref:Nucleoside 2-deoxyribosyltransferase n=1 Tax=Dictyoglomus thermophilum TaxID=14 RepID=A0A7C3RKN5_DICTH